jgi:6-phosphogluconolactonase
MSKFVEILSDKTALIERSLELVIAKIQNAIEERGQFTIALSGGSTPKPLYEALGKQSLLWSKIHIFWGDERYVAPNHPDSNQLMTRQAWLDRIDIPPANIHPMPTEAENPQFDVERYQQELKRFFQLQEGEFPVFDLILLGMGDDGHTASLFPHTPALKINNQLVTIGNKDGQTRITFTAPLINRARCVMFLVAGASKRPALQAIFAETANVENYPARLIRPEGELWWLLDKEAGIAIEERVNSTT